MYRFITLMVFVTIALGGGLLIGYLTAPGEWYAGLNKPSFNPPGWIFGPVWTVLYIAIAIAGWLVSEDSQNGWGIKLWWGQLALNFAWSPVFFSAHQTGLALAIIVALLLTIAAFIVAVWHKTKPAALLFLPYASWVAFATVLNASIFFMN